MKIQAHGAVSDRWQANCKASTAWAFEAFDSLRESLSQDVKSRMASASPEAYVVVFGRTQVGKTTLLLELMGVDAASLDRVSTVLRGGRGKGQSATATVMEYGRSRDTAWSLQMPNQPPARYMEDAEAAEALGALRHQMESQQLHLERAVRLDIPCDCFAPVEEGNASVRMLDLPGDGASNPVEQRHVEQVAERYLAAADLILLVGKVDDLSFLKPVNLLLPGIEDWQIVPERFRIITTYSFTAKSVQDVVRKKGIDIEHIRRRLLEQLETFGRLSPDARQADRLFPLEFGQSLEGAARNDPELVDQIKPVVNKLKADLVAQINTATAPMARLSAALRSHVTVAKVKEQKLLEMAAKREGLVKICKLAEDDLDAATKVVSAKAKQLTIRQLRHEQLMRVHPDSWVSAACTLDASEPATEVGRSKKSVKALQVCIDAFRDWLCQRYRSISAKGVDGSLNLEWFWRGVTPPLEEDLPVIRRLLDLHLGPIESRLHDYWTDGYLVDSNFETDVAAVKSAMREAVHACGELASKRWLGAIQRQIQAHRQALQDAKRDVSLYEQLKREMEGKVASANKAVAKSEKRSADFEVRMAADQERCHAFKGMLDERYEQQLASMVDRLRSNTDPSIALVDLISCVHLIEARSKLLATVSPATSHPHKAH